MAEARAGERKVHEEGEANEESQTVYTREEDGRRGKVGGTRRRMAS